MTTVSTLKQRPEFIKQCLTLIEEAFHYPPEEHFHIDFYPLMAQENHEHNYILLNDNELLCHIGLKLRTLVYKNKTLPIALLGGIATSSKHLGRGHFKELMNHILEKHEGQVALFLLWSEKSELYNKFRFYPIGIQQEYLGTGTDSLAFKPLSQLSQKEREHFHNLYFTGHLREDAHLLRSEKDFLDIFSIHSASIAFITNERGEQSYVVKNKGADLTNIIHEVGGEIPFHELITLLPPVPIWPHFENRQELAENNAIYLCSARIGNTDLLEDLITFRNDQFHTLFQLDETLSFFYQKKMETFHEKEFLQMIFGPEAFTDLYIPISLTGLESV